MPEHSDAVRSGPEGTIACPGTPAEVLDRLDAAARRGRLPGFHRGSTSPGAPLFELTDFGSPFEARLTAAATPAGDGTTLSFAPIRLKPLFPWVFALILALTVWPGVWLTDSMIRTYWDWYSAAPWWITYAWYIPLTLPFCPVAMLSAVKKSRVAAAAELPELLRKIAAATGGRVNPARG